MNFTKLAIGAFFLHVAACSSTNAGQAAAGGGADGGSGAPVTRPLSCAAIFDCAGSCTDDACSNACLAKGSSDAQTSATALAKCFNDHMCTDGACLTANCETEAETCLAQGKAMGTPLPAGGEMPGSVPKELVGSWAHANDGEDERFKLNADGTGYYQSAVTSTGGCAITNETNWDGTVVVDATTVTVYGTTVTNEEHVCGSKNVTTSPPQTLHFTYTYDAGTDVFTAIDSNCAAKYPDSPSSQELYCKNVYARE